MTLWTDERIKRLEMLWGEGLSITAIGQKLTREFGGTVSRNAVVGKASRIGLAQQHKREPALKPPKRKSHQEQAAEQQLTSVQRAAAMLRAGWSVDEIATAMNVKTSTVQVYLSNARGTGLLQPGRAPVQISSREIEPRRDAADIYGSQKCLWPQVNPEIDPEICTEERVPTRPYCPAHCRRAYTTGAGSQGQPREDAA